MHYGIEAVRARTVLRQWSQECSTEVEHLAEALLRGVADGGRVSQDPTVVRWLEQRLRRPSDGVETP